MEQVFDTVRPVVVVPEAQTSEVLPNRLTTEYSLARITSMNMQLGTKFEDQWVTPYMSRIFPWALNYSCGGADYPHLFADWSPIRTGQVGNVQQAAKDRWRRIAGAAILTPGQYAQHQATRPEGQIAADWVLVPAARNLHWRYEVLHASFVSCKQRLAAGEPLHVNLAELINAATKLWQRMQKGSIKVAGRTTPLNGELGMIFRADDITKGEKIILASYFKTTQSIAGCQAIRRRIGHCLFGMRAVYGECVFVTISPNRRHSGMLLHLSRTRINDPTLRSTSAAAEMRREYANSRSPSMFMNGLPNNSSAVEGSGFARLSHPVLESPRIFRIRI